MLVELGEIPICADFFLPLGTIEHCAIDIAHRSEYNSEAGSGRLRLAEATDLHETKKKDKGKEKARPRPYRTHIRHIL
jgi:hypothetical protein